MRDGLGKSASMDRGFRKWTKGWNLRMSGLQLIGEVCSLVEQGSGAELVFGDGRPAAQEGVVVVSNRFRVLGHEKLCPILNLVAVAHVEGVAFELERLFEIGKLLIAEAGSFAERAGRTYPANRGGLVGE